MLYRHEHFTLNTGNKTVLNKHNEAVNLTGHAYSLLELLCLKHPEALRLNDIDLAFDSAGAKNYTEDYIRTLRQKIKTALNSSVIVYENNIYKLAGGLMPAEQEGVPVDYPRLKAEANIPQTTFKLPTPKKKTLLIVVLTTLVFVLGVSAYIYRDNLPLLKNGSENLPRPVDDMVLIPAGDFTMGSTEAEIKEAAEICKKDEGNWCVSEMFNLEYPAHVVHLQDYFIDRKEVSNDNFMMFLDATNYQGLQKTSLDYLKLNVVNLPVTYVTLEDAVAYCAWVNKRLPTAAEWEKAARGIDGRLWTWGSVWDQKIANHGKGGADGRDDSDGYLDAAPVGATSDLSPYGVLNMSGNVTEWVDDAFMPYEGNDKYSLENFDFKIPVTKGGSFLSPMQNLRVALRQPYNPNDAYENTGFRCAKDK